MASVVVAFRRASPRSQNPGSPPASSSEAPFPRYTRQRSTPQLASLDEHSPVGPLLQPRGFVERRRRAAQGPTTGQSLGQRKGSATNLGRCFSHSHAPVPAAGTGIAEDTDANAPHYPRHTRQHQATSTHCLERSEPSAAGPAPTISDGATEARKGFMVRRGRMARHSTKISLEEAAAAVERAEGKAAAKGGTKECQKMLSPTGMCPELPSAGLSPRARAGFLRLSAEVESH